RRAPDGALYVVAGDETSSGQVPRRVLRIDAGGALAWERDLCPGAAQPATARIAFAVASDGAAANLCDVAGRDRLVRRARDGSATEATLPFDRALQLQAGAGGELLVLGRDQATTPYRTHLIALDAALRQRDVSLGAANSREALELAAAAIDADGNGYLLSRRAATGAVAAPRFLSRIRADGRTVWRKTLPASLAQTATLQAAHGLVCVEEQTTTETAASHHAFCLRSADGATFGNDYAAPAGTTVLIQRPIAGERIVRVSATATQYAVDLLGETGSARTASGTGRLHNLGIDDDGRVTLAVDGRVLRYDVAGALLYRIDQSPIVKYDARFTADAAGRVYATGARFAPYGLDDHVLWAVDAAGATRWLTALGPYRRGERIVTTANAVYVHGQSDPGDDALASVTSKHDAEDGRQLWSHRSVDRIVAGDAHGPLLALDAAAGDVVLLGSWANRLRLERLNATDGRRELERFVDCNGDCAPLAAVALDAAGELRTAYTVVDRGAGQTAAARSLGDVLRDAPATRVDQPGVAGLWYAPYANGEGLAIDWLADSRTVFAAWFTYTSSGGYDPAQQRWYTLQANGVASGTTELELPVLQTVGGAFDAGPAVSPRIVGRAKLRVTDCDHASLSYEIDAGATTEPASGTIDLLRLTPATQACVLADGSNVPGAGARPPAKGFDARMSGAWYDETTVGQGLQLNIQPDGVFFAPWFAYDPPGMPDDSTRQHWFTLQGNLADAVDGRVEVLLIQTLGGRFDWAPTYDANVIGSATLIAQGCDRAALEYRFDAGRSAGSFAGRQGRLDLRRMGGCAP
ncbi:hypothetical protein, partial [Tahibacter caeni]|uniref:hypothetical protein n=1 Tax=Tahibacter caeni TaxID=1453545 RepID=UPI002147E5B3